MSARPWFMALPLAAAPSVALATTYYVSPDGNDRAAGTSVGAAWRTVAPVNATHFAAGDHVLFAGGSVFTGPLNVGPAASGTAAKPVVFGSFGTGRATIDAGPAQGDAISVQGATGVTFQRLNLTGAGLATGRAKPAVGLRLSNVDTVEADRIEASGFQWAGIELSGSKSVTLTNVNAHHNGYAGISSDGGYVRNTTGGRSHNLTVSDCQADDNPGDPYFPGREGGSYNGNGVVLFGVDGATVQYCEAARNGTGTPNQGGGGPDGIWAAHADNLLFQYDIAHDNDSRVGTDGGGFDFDGGTTNSVLQYSYAYNNASIGIYLFEYGSDEGWANNTARYNVAVNDGQKYDGAELSVGYADSGQKFSGALVHHNFFYNDDPSVVLLGANLGQHPGSYAFYDNVAVAATAGQLVSGGESAADNPFAGNAYATLDGSGGAAGYTSLAAWRAATGEETFDGKATGLQGVGLKLRGPLAPPPKLIDPHRLGELGGYGYLAGSPLATGGVDVAQAGLANVTRDFFGATASKTAIGPGGGKAPAAPLLANGDFANGIGTFSSYSAAVVDAQGLDGGRAAVVSGAFGGVWQTLTNLAPGATYELSGYLRSSTPAGGAYLYAQFFNGAGSLVEGDVTNTRAFTRTAVTFTTGSGQTTADVGVFKTSSDNDGIADNLYVRRIK